MGWSADIFFTATLQGTSCMFNDFEAFEDVNESD